MTAEVTRFVHRHARDAPRAAVIQNDQVRLEALDARFGEHRRKLNDPLETRQAELGRQRLACATGLRARCPTTPDSMSRFPRHARR
jgi:hypothetical protein